MVNSKQDSGIRISLDTKGCELSAATISAMEEDLHTLRQIVANFPVSVLYISVIYHRRSSDYHIKTSLVLPGRTLFTGEHGSEVFSAYDRCIRKLVKKVEAYKQRMQGNRLQQGARCSVSASHAIAIDELETSVVDDDYARFRQSVGVFEEGLAERIGRWTKRYPQLEAQLGESITIADIVEDVFLNAFEQFASRPQDVPPGEWLQSLIDPTVQAIIQSPDEEFSRISYSRAVQQAAAESDRSSEDRPRAK